MHRSVDLQTREDHAQISSLLVREVQQSFGAGYNDDDNYDDDDDDDKEAEDDNDDNSADDDNDNNDTNNNDNDANDNDDNDANDDNNNDHPYDDDDAPRSRGVFSSLSSRILSFYGQRPRYGTKSGRMGRNSISTSVSTSVRTPLAS